MTTNSAFFKEDTLTLAGYTFTQQLPLTKTKQGEDVFCAKDIQEFEKNIALWLIEKGVCHGDAFRFLRKILGWKAQDAAQTFGLTVETLSRWENDHRPPDPHVMALLGSIVLDFFEGKENTLQRLRATQHPLPSSSSPISFSTPILSDSSQCVPYGG
jgi:transcriptional regulator with XRE-family HTH domain